MKDKQTRENVKKFSLFSLTKRISASIGYKSLYKFLNMRNIDWKISDFLNLLFC